jgi:hypothetical protein
MGFLSKIGKGLKSAFKKVGKAIKSGLNSIGKFMDKIGIVGQIGLSLLLPGIGGMLASSFQGLVGAMGAYSGVGSTIVKAAGGFLNSVGTVAGNMGKAFSSVTGAIKNVVGETLKFGANKLGLGKVASSLGSTFGSQGLTDLGTSISKGSFDNITGAVKGLGASFKDIGTSFSDVFNPDVDPMKGLTDIQDTGAVPTTAAPSADALREQASTQIQQLKDSGMSLDAIRQEIPSEYLDLVDPIPQDSLLNPVQQGVTVGGDTLPDTLDTMASDFELQRQKALTTKLPAVGDKNFVLETTQKVQSDLADKLRKKALDVREGFTAFREDPLGVSAGFAVDKTMEGAEAGFKRRGMEFVAGDMTPDPVFNTYSIAAAAPVDYVEVAPAQQMSQEYFAQNQNLFNTHPYGATSFAVDNNYYQDLNTTMQRMG